MPDLTHAPTPQPVVREPKQERTRQSWERVLAVGRALVEERGVAGLTVTEVCRRSGINAPSLYARVDGRAGLFAAVWASGMDEIRVTEDRVFEGLPVPGASAEERAADAARAMAEVFRVHARFLRPVINHAASDPSLLESGAAQSARLLARTAATIGGDPDAAREATQTLYAECVVRTMYGPAFFTGHDHPESDDEFVARLTRGAVGRVGKVG